MVTSLEFVEDWVGIDFGSAYSAGALYSENKRDGKNIIDFEFDDGDRLLSSIVNLDNRGNFRTGSPKKTDHSSFQEIKKQLGSPGLSIKGTKGDKVSCERAASKIFREIKDAADNKADTDVKNCVISIPYHYNDSKK